ncbi:MAG: hypothetical protein DCC71_00715, partial [Proteobacteria bacterium]
MWTRARPLLRAPRAEREMSRGAARDDAPRGAKCHERRARGAASHLQLRLAVTSNRDSSRNPEDSMALERLLSAISKPVADVLGRALEERELGVADATVLLGAQGADLLALMQAADVARRAD